MQSQITKYFVTTPIFYVNAKPHLGHVYTVLLADAQNRFQKLRKPQNHQTLFTTGTDEHGLKIQQASEKNGFSNPIHFCDSVSREFNTTFDSFQIVSDDFIRTSEERHRNAVCHFWKKLQNNGFLKKKTYQSWYCVQDESFLTEYQIDVSKKISLESGHPIEWATEENYVFPLEQFRTEIKSWLKENQVIQPNIFQNQLNNLLNEEMPDLSVSRSASRLKWGIPVPNDPSQTIYVWLDALINYLTVCGYPGELKNWPPDCHVIGKDILKFHAIYWPSFLMAAGIDLPKKIFCHSHWTINDEKMSKSKGNVVDPNELAENLATHEGLRYFLLRQGVPHSDGNYNQELLVKILNSELANTLGNLLNRITAKSINLDQSFYPSDIQTDLSHEAEDLKQFLQDLPQTVENHYECFNFYLGIVEIMECLRKVNLLVQQEKPWELKKQGNFEKLGAVLNLSLNSVRICAILLQPIIPGLSDKILNKLNVQKRTFEDAKLLPEYNENHKLSHENVKLFKKI